MWHRNEFAICKLIQYLLSVSDDYHQGYPIFQCNSPPKKIHSVFSFPFSKLMCHWSISLRSTFYKILIRGWAEKFIGWLWLQWSNLTKCGLFFIIVFSAVHTLLPSVLQRLDSRCMKVLILILKKVLNCRYDLIIDLILLPSQVFFSCWGNRKIVRWCQIRRIWRVINQFKPTVKHNSHCNHRFVCRSIVLVKQVSFHQFSRPFWNVSATTFQSPELLI